MKHTDISKVEEERRVRIRAQAGRFNPKNIPFIEDICEQCDDLIDACLCGHSLQAGSIGELTAYRASVPQYQNNRYPSYIPLSREDQALVELTRVRRLAAEEWEKGELLLEQAKRHEQSRQQTKDEAEQRRIEDVNWRRERDRSTEEKLGYPNQKNVIGFIWEYPYSEEWANSREAANIERRILDFCRGKGLSR